jgi:outer membrane protein
MKRFFVLSTISLCLLTSLPVFGAQAPEGIKTVNLQTCLDASEIGKKDLQRFEKMKRQIEEGLELKEKRLNELAPKFTEEYLDSISPEEEKKLKAEFQALSQEFSQEQSNYYQTLNRAQMDILQKMQDRVMIAAKAIAKDKNISLVIRNDACIFSDDSLDLTKEIVSYIDSHTEKDAVPETKVEKK